MGCSYTMTRRMNSSNLKSAALRGVEVFVMQTPNTAPPALSTRLKNARDLSSCAPRPATIGYAPAHGLLRFDSVLVNLRRLSPSSTSEIQSPGFAMAVLKERMVPVSNVMVDSQETPSRLLSQTVGGGGDGGGTGGGDVGGGGGGKGGGS